MFIRLKNLWRLSSFGVEEYANPNKEPRLTREVQSKPKKKLATIINMEPPLEQFPNEENDDNPR